jgi:hypothetical protein
MRLRSCQTRTTREGIDILFHPTLSGYVPVHVAQPFLDTAYIFGYSRLTQPPRLAWWHSQLQFLIRLRPACRSDMYSTSRATAQTSRPFKHNTVSASTRLHLCTASPSPTHPQQRTRWSISISACEPEVPPDDNSKHCTSPYI